MTLSLGQNLNVAVLGATGGIGAALVRCLEADSNVGAISAFSRTPIDSTGSKTANAVIDLRSEDTIRNAARFAARNDPLDVVIVATGTLHRGNTLKPEKGMRELSSEALAEAFAVNAIGPAIVAKHFLPEMRRGRKTVFAALSARVGSIADNRLGGWFSYRSSKAALNMLLRTFSIEQSRRLPHSLVVALHPGTVDTNLSRPFTTNLDQSRLFTPERAARQLLAVIDKLVAADTGGFFAWDGSRIEY